MPEVVPLTDVRTVKITRETLVGESETNHLARPSRHSGCPCIVDRLCGPARLSETSGKSRVRAGMEMLPNDHARAGLFSGSEAGPPFTSKLRHHSAANPAHLTLY